MKRARPVNPSSPAVETVVVDLIEGVVPGAMVLHPQSGDQTEHWTIPTPGQKRPCKCRALRTRRRPQSLPAFCGTTSSTPSLALQ